MRRVPGFSLVELSVAVAIFGFFLLILAGLDGQLRRLDRSSRMELMTHPENIGVLTRLRRDALDSRGYPAGFAGELQTPHSLILALDPPATAVWKFDGQVATRTEYSGSELRMRWRANGVPRYKVSGYEMPDGSIAVRLVGRDGKDRLIVDEIFLPRTP